MRISRNSENERYAQDIYLNQNIVNGIPLQRVSRENMKNNKLNKNIVSLLWRDQYDQIGYGTGLLISPDLVLTSAHNFYHNMQRVKNEHFEIHPGLCGRLGERPYRIKDSYIPQQYINQPLINNTVNDYALIKLYQNVVGSKDFMNLNFNFIDQGQPIAIFGYPFQKYENSGDNNILMTDQWGLKQAGAIVQMRHNSRQAVYKISTMKGQSGSPIVEIKGNQMNVIGIHQGGLTTNKVALNTGRILTRQLIEVFKNKIKDWRAQMFGEPRKVTSYEEKEQQYLSIIQSFRLELQNKEIQIKQMEKNHKKEVRDLQQKITSLTQRLKQSQSSAKQVTVMEEKTGNGYKELAAKLKQVKSEMATKITQLTITNTVKKNLVSLRTTISLVKMSQKRRIQ